MVFSSLFFVFAFLPLTLAFYYCCPARWRNVVAVAASLVFYAWGAPRFVWVLLVSCLIDHGISRRLVREAPRRRAWLALALAGNIGVLLYCKYANFGVAQVNALLGACGRGGLSWTAVALPIGISFFTFQKISYLVDLYRGVVAPARRFLDYVLYVALFPQLIAGPIVRYHDVAEQIVSRTHSWEKTARGIRRFCIGLAKKTLIANILAEVAEKAFAADPGALTPGQAWVGVCCYAFQIYFDFSGYSDMAIGLARMMGFELFENFNHPYISRNFTEFWRRWHISLSNWMREYVYVPLGGNRRGAVRTYVNLWLVFLISGFWHGAAWNFVVWGAYHGLFLCIDKLLRNTRMGRLPDWLTIPGTFLLVLVGWVFFRANDLPHALQYLGRMSALFGPQVAETDWPALLSLRQSVALGMSAALSFAPAWWSRERPAGWIDDGESAWRRYAAYAGVLVLLVLATCFMASGGFNPFIYFRF